MTLETLEHFSAGLRDIGIHPRSQARILSGIRSFYHFLLLEDYIQQDPTELLESPQIGKHLPDVLTVEEIDALIGSIDRSTREGQRNLRNPGNTVQLRPTSFGIVQPEVLRPLPEGGVHQSRRKGEQATAGPDFSTGHQRTGKLFPGPWRRSGQTRI